MLDLDPDLARYQIGCWTHQAYDQAGFFAVPRRDEHQQRVPARRRVAGHIKRKPLLPGVKRLLSQRVPCAPRNLEHTPRVQWAQQASNQLRAARKRRASGEHDAGLLTGRRHSRSTGRRWQRHRQRHKQQRSRDHPAMIVVAARAKRSMEKKGSESKHLLERKNLTSRHSRLTSPPAVEKHLAGATALKRHSGQTRLPGTPDAKKCTRTLVSTARLGGQKQFLPGPAQQELASGHDRRSSCKAMQGQIRLPPFRFRNLRIRRARVSYCPFRTDNRPRTPMQVRSDVGKPLWHAASHREQRLARALLNAHRGPRLVFKGEQP